MAKPRKPMPSLLVIPAFSRHLDALDWARDRLIEAYGPVALTSPDFDFKQTTYYETTMGSGLKKRFLAFTNLIETERLPDVKLFTNTLEEELAATKQYPEVRPLNLDPGLIQLGKFMLATTKDQGHRIYLRDGIFAEVTLRFVGGAFETWPWTYRDYREPEVRAFLGEARAYFHERLRERR